MNATYEQIAARAYQLWQSRGGGYGHQVEDWLQAERELAPVQVVLVSAGPHPIPLLKEVRAVTHQELVAVKELLGGLPRALTGPLPPAEAERIRRRLEAAGATIELRPEQVGS